MTMDLPIFVQYNRVSSAVTLRYEVLVGHLYIPGGGGGGYSLIKVTEDATLRLLPRAVQQSKLLPRVDIKSHFRRSRAGTTLYFNGHIAEK